MNKETLTGGGRGGVDQINPAALAEPVINDCWQESRFDFLFNKYNDSINKAGRMEATFGSIIDGRSPHNSNYYRNTSTTKYWHYKSFVNTEMLLILHA